MRTTFEERGPAELPTPSEVIGAFDTTHKALMESALSLNKEPTGVSLEEFQRRAVLAGQSVTPLSIRGFFREAGPEPLGESVDRIIGAAKEVFATTLFINPLWSTGEKEASMESEEAIEALNDEDEDVAIKKAQELCKNYNVLVVNMQEALLRSPAVASLVTKQARKKEMLQGAFAMGVVGVGAFLGTYLAQRRKK